MAGLQTSVGLISGIDIKGVVDQLIAIESVPYNNLLARQEKLQKQQAIYVQLTQFFNTTTYMIRNLGKVEIFDRRDVKSSNDSILKVTRTSNPQPGNYTFTPLKLAQAQTTLSSGVASDKVALNKEGEITIQFGRDLTTNYSLADINGGDGFDRGYIRITDATGARANIDLRNAQSFNDILEAINSCKDIDVYARMEGDHLLLKDYSGGTGTLRVQEVNGGTTARSLGLTDVAEVGGELRGKNLFWMGANTSLSLLNDGAGIVFDNMFDDLYVRLADGTNIAIDFNPLPTSTSADPTQKFMATVGDLLKTINDAGKVGSVQKLQAKISADGKRLEFVDNTAAAYPLGSMTITQNSLTGGPTIKPILYQLGLAEWGQDSITVRGTATGRAILGDLDSVLLSSLNGGRGFPESSLFDGVAPGDSAILGARDQAGNFTYITISRAEYAAAQTLEDLCRMINSKLAGATLFEEGTYNRIPQLDEFNNPVLVTYPGDVPKYQTLPSSNKLPWDYLVKMQTVDTLGTPPGTHASWIYDADNPSKIVGYRSDESSILCVYGDTGDPDKITAIRRPSLTNEVGINQKYIDLGAYTGGERPLLDKNGVPIIIVRPQTTNSVIGSTGEGGADVVRFITGYAEWNTSEQGELEGWQEESGIDDKITGYELDNGDIVWFSKSEVELLAENGVDGVTDFPVLEDGVLKTWEDIHSYDINLHSGEEKNYLGDPEYAFDVTWKFDTTDPTQVIGYTIKYYDSQVTPSGPAWTDIQSLPPGILPYINKNGNLVYDSLVRTSANPDYAWENLGNEPTLEDHGFEWLYEDDNPANAVIGYKLGDGQSRLFSQDELDGIDESPDGEKYPVLKFESEYVYQTGVGLELRVNAEGTGLEIVDTTGRRDGAILFGDLPTYGGNFAVALGFGGGVEANATKIIGSSLNVQTVSFNTKISDLNGGQGVNLTNLSMTITDTSGKTSGTIDLSRCQTIGDVIQAINNSSASAIARINNTGDGITIEDLAGGTVRDLTITQIGGANNALAGLGIKTGSVKNAELAPGQRASLSGSTKYTVTVEKNDTLDDIRRKINELGPYFKATTINDGSANPYRLSITGSATGAAGNMKIDLSVLGLNTTVMSKAQDACILYGDPGSGTSLMLNSKTNTFNGVISGISFTISGTSSTPISVWTENSPADIKNSLRTFVENYNKLKQFMNENTLIDVNANQKGMLAQDSTLLQLERDLNELLLKTFSNLGPIRTLADVGIKIVPVSQWLNQEEGDTEENAKATRNAMLYAGMIEFDESVFDRLYESSPDAIREFFTKTQETFNSKGELVTKQIGYASLFENIYQVYSYDPETSALNSKFNAFDRQIYQNEQRLNFMQERLDVKRTMLLKKFYAMETAMGKMQSDMNYINNISAAMANNSSK
ncbi:MAG: flagellar filament capping protein FliD [Planctomycetaceae bacterium]|nr:flagellar filament capping protein FliD [Planctomycetaceae bacterium]